jgi:hypothetical protein
MCACRRLPSKRRDYEGRTVRGRGSLRYRNDREQSRNSYQKRDRDVKGERDQEQDRNRRERPSQINRGRDYER